MQIIGHQKQLTYFETLKNEGRLHHAYLLVGPHHVGKTTLALAVSANLLDTSTQKLALHPDFFELERIDEEGNLKRDITVEHIEKVTARVARSPLASAYNIILIEDADKMNSYAANALLKTLEEPATPTVFFLLTSNEEKVLPTIKSRVQSLYISPVLEKILLESLQPQYKDKKGLEEMVQASFGLPGKVISWIENPESFENYKKEKERFFSLFGKPFFEKLALIEPLFGDKKAHIEGREELISILLIWEECLQIGSPQLSSGVQVALYDIIRETIERLGQNVHPRLLMENLLLTIP